MWWNSMNFEASFALRYKWKKINFHTCTTHCTLFLVRISYRTYDMKWIIVQGLGVSPIFITSHMQKQMAEKKTPEKACSKTVRLSVHVYRYWFFIFLFDILCSKRVVLYLPFFISGVFHFTALYTFFLFSCDLVILVDTRRPKMEFKFKLNG